jgi:hypothetical protein
MMSATFGVAALVASEEDGVSGEWFSGGSASGGRPWWLAMLLRGPGDRRSLLAKVLITLVIVAGAVCVLGSGVIHLYLWGKQYGYRSIPTIGPLFLLQGIVSILIGLLTLISRRVWVVLVAAGLMVTSFIALIIAVEVGLFGFQDSWTSPYALTALYDEIVGAAVLLAAAVALAWPPRLGASPRQATQGQSAVGASRVDGS